MRTLTIARIGVWSAVTRMSLSMAACGFVLGLGVALWAAVLASSFTLATGIDATGAGMALLVILPLGGALALWGIGVSMVFVFAATYNLLAGWLGGIRLEVEDEARPGGFGEYGDL